MKEFLLVDGYNMIHAWEDLSEVMEFSLEAARDKLIDILCNYRGLVKAEIIVVFDAQNVRGGITKEIIHNNIYVVYTKEAETADSYIERTVRIIGRRYKVRVATSDGTEQMIILGSGGTRLTPRELRKEIEDAMKHMRKTYIEDKPPKNNMLIDNLDPTMAKWLEDLRKYKP